MHNIGNCDSDDTNLHHASEFQEIGKEVGSEYLQRVLGNAPGYLLKIVAEVTEGLLRKIEVPEKEIEKFSDQVKERRMGELFTNFEPYSVQKTREEGRIEGREEGRLSGFIEGLVRTGKKFQLPREQIRKELEEEYRLNPEEAEQKLAQYWE